MTKPKKPPPLHVAEFRRITSINDPLAALDECSAAMDHAGQEFWTKKHTHLGVLADTYERIRKSKKSWRKFIEKPFWNDPKLSGKRPTMKDRSDGLGFVVRYGKEAIRRKKSKLSWRHTVVTEYLLDHGVKPIAFATYLGTPGQGINATYKKAQAEKKLANDGGEAPRIAKPKESAKVVAKDQKGSVNSTQKSGDAEEQSAVYATTFKAKLIGKRELMEPLVHLSGNSTMDIRVKPVQDERGRRWYKVVKLLPTPATKQTTSERRKSNPRQGKPSPHGVKNSSRKPRRTAR